MFLYKTDYTCPRCKQCSLEDTIKIGEVGSYKEPMTFKKCKTADCGFEERYYETDIRTEAEQ